VTGPAKASRGFGWTMLQAAIILFAAIWIYWPALRGGWLWDDGLEISRNPVLREGRGWLAPWTTPAGMDYFPLKDTVQWVEWRLWTDHVAGYHLMSLALQIWSSLLEWRLLYKLGVRHGWLGGLLFAIHPVAVESVAWISELKNTLSLPLLLLALGAYLDWDAAGRARGIGYALSLFWFLAAMLCKSSVVMLPFVLLLFTYWRKRRIGRSDLLVVAPFFAIAIALGGVTFWFQSQRAMHADSGTPAFDSRFVQAGWNVVAYFGSCVFPIGLAPIYSAIRSELLGILSWLAVAGALGLFWNRKGTWGRHALLGAGWFLLNLAPVLGLVPMAYLRVAPRADHLAYLALVGVAGLAGASLSLGWDVAGAGWRRCSSAGGAAVVFFALAIVSRVHAAVFRDERTFWTEAAFRQPESWLAHNNLGRISLDDGHAEAALEQLRMAEVLRPDSGEVHANLGQALDALKRASEGEVEYRKAIQLDPSFGPFHYDLGKSLLISGRPADAAVELRAALRLEPSLPEAHNNLGLALARMGFWTEAMREYEAALQLDPRLPEAHLNRGNAYFRQGNLAAAVVEYEATLRANPHYAPAHQNLAYALRRLGREAEAEREFEAASSAAGPH